MNSGAIAKPELPAADRKALLFRQWAAANRRRRLSALVFILPALLFLVFNFITPLSMMLSRSIDDREVGRAFPRTVQTLVDWKGKELPGADTADALFKDIRSRDRNAFNLAVSRLNFDYNGMRSLLSETARKIKDDHAASMERLIDINEKWGEIDVWQAFARAAGPQTTFFFLAASDLRKDADGTIHKVSADQAVFQTIFVRTIWVGAVVAVACLLLGYPLAYLLANTRPAVSRILLLFVLLPFWTSLLVRTTAWVILLQKDGIINQLLRSLGIISEPLSLIYNRIGVYISDIYVLLPFMILILYTVMKNISPDGMRAATSLGAHPLVAFFLVYVPQTATGIASGLFLVFVLAIGYYITPALVGGANDQMISYFIAFYMSETLNWGLSAALSAILLTITIGVMAVVFFAVRRPASA